MFNRKPLIAAIFIVAAIFFSGFFAGVWASKKTAHCDRIIYDTAYISMCGDRLVLLADETGSPRK